LAYTGTSNAVNLTDGLDGLVSGVLLSFWCVMLFLCEQLTPLALTWQWPMQELLILCWINLVSIGCFMSLNYYPAMIFMGDSGALALGSAIAAVFCYLKSPLLLIVLLFVPVIEALSVILQISSFKLFKKRIFKMAPLHHHFELSGYSETSVMLSLSALNLVVALVGLYFFWTARGTFLGL
jgi:phospho-N-acetylmuramoyl-pentapeptide-transferase